MVYHRKPLARLVGPVPGEERALAVTVLADVESACGNSVIRDVESAQLTGGRRCGEGEGEMISGVGVTQRAAVTCDASDRHALAGRGCCESEEEAGEAAVREPDRDRGVAAYLVGRVIEGERELVVL